MDMYRNKLVDTDRDYTVVYFFIKLYRHVNNVERINPIDFRGHRSKVKVKRVIIDKCGVRGDATLCVVIFSFMSMKSKNIFTKPIQRNGQNLLQFVDNCYVNILQNIFTLRNMVLCSKELCEGNAIAKYTHGRLASQVSNVNWSTM